MAELVTQYCSSDWQVQSIMHSHSIRRSPSSVVLHARTQPAPHPTAVPKPTFHSDSPHLARARALDRADVPSVLDSVFSVPLVAPEPPLIPQPDFILQLQRLIGRRRRLASDFSPILSPWDERLLGIHHMPTVWVPIPWQLAGASRVAPYCLLILRFLGTCPAVRRPLLVILRCFFKSKKSSAMDRPGLSPM